MKTLLLMRHAKSSWKHADLADFERPLNKRGKKDAPAVGHWLKARNLVPDFILSSSAVRAAQTAEAVAEAAGLDQHLVDFQDQLYLAEADDYLTSLRELPDGINLAMVVGHNPGAESLLQILSGKIEPLPTAVVAILALPVAHWADLSAETDGQLIDVLLPREIRKEEHDEKQKEKEKDKPKKKKGK